METLLSVLIVSVGVAALIVSAFIYWRSSVLRAKEELKKNAEDVIIKCRVIYPEVKLSFNQHMAYGLLMTRKDIYSFNKYANRTLSVEERDEVLELVTLNEIFN
jgi:hypothetical protein